jgi:hypothetical protein
MLRHGKAGSGILPASQAIPFSGAATGAPLGDKVHLELP